MTNMQILSTDCGIFFYFKIAILYGRHGYWRLLLPVQTTIYIFQQLNTREQHEDVEETDQTTQLSVDTSNNYSFVLIY